MSDRIATITVVIERNIRDDDCKSILNAICMIKGVLSAKANIANPQDYMAEVRVKHEIGDKLWKVLYPDLKL